jgi:hypothetical protein
VEYTDARQSCNRYLMKRSDTSIFSMTEGVNGVYPLVIHGVCVVTGITHAPPSVMYTMHGVNMLTRLILLCLGIALFSTNQHKCVSGLVIQPYKRSEWHTVTHTDWMQDRLPDMKTVVGPGNTIVVSLWFTTIICFFINDALRCALVFTGNWFTVNNHMDMSWSTLSCSGIPFLFTCVAVQLGTRDVFMLTAIMFITIVSGVCGAITEHLRTIVNPYTIHGMSENILWVLRTTQNSSLIIASQLVTVPMIFNIWDNDYHEIFSDVVVVILFTLLTYGLTIVSYRHHRLCSIFEQTWPTRCSMVPWCVVDTDTTEHTTTAGDPWSDTVKSAKTLKTPGDIDIGSEENIETNAEMFDKLYGCHIWKSDNADIVHVVDQDHRVLTVELTDDFSMYNQMYKMDSISRCGEISRGLHIAQLGAAPQLFHTYIDEFGIRTRRMIGLLTEWRRYYLINMLIDAILFTTLLNMTGVVGCE